MPDEVLECIQLGHESFTFGQMPEFIEFQNTMILEYSM